MCEMGGCGYGHGEGFCEFKTGPWLTVPGEESMSYFRVLEALTWEELAGCGRGRGVAAGTDSHPESVSEQGGQKPAHFGLVGRFI